MRWKRLQSVAAYHHLLVTQQTLTVLSFVFRESRLRTCALCSCTGRIRVLEMVLWLVKRLFDSSCQGRGVLFIAWRRSYTKWDKSWEENNAEITLWLYLEVCGCTKFTARNQPHLSLFTHRLPPWITSHRLQQNWEKTVNTPHCLFASAAKVRGYLRSLFEKPLIRQPCCDEVSWQHTQSWISPCTVWSVKQQGESADWHLGRVMMWGEL